MSCAGAVAGGMKDRASLPGSSWRCGSKEWRASKVPRAHPESRRLLHTAIVVGSSIAAMWVVLDLFKVV